ncbi:MAG: hypothetical protein ACI9EF_000484 [Pseudohongiellaceae bacterium]|jgi:hypothetical protein
MTAGPAGATVPATVAAVAPAACTDELVIDKSTVVFGPLGGATHGAEVDINEIYANHPAFMRMQSLGLDSSDGRGKKMLNQAKKSVKSALAAVASDEDLHVITHLGGVSGGEIDIEDHTAAVIDLLPVYHIDGALWAGKSRARDNIAEMDKEAVLLAIPAYRDWLNLAPSDTEYHFLKEEWNRAFHGALNSVVRDESLEAVVQTGGVTSRLEPAPEITDMVIEALDI